MTPDGRVKKAHKDYFDSMGWYHYWPIPMGMGGPIVDCLLCVEGKFVAIEVKKPGTCTPTKRQGFVLKRVHQSGGISFTTDDLDRTIKYLQDHALGLYNPETGD